MSSWRGVAWLVIGTASISTAAASASALSPPGQALDRFSAGGRGKPGEVAAANAGTAAPQVEIVAVREDADLLLYVDDYASNTPLTGLQVDLHLGSRSLRAAPTADGRYRLPADPLDDGAASSPTVTLVGSGVDLSLPIALPPAPASAARGMIDAAGPGQSQVRWIPLAVSGWAIAVALFVAAGRRRGRHRLPQPS